MSPISEIQENQDDTPAMLPSAVPMISPQADMAVVIEAFLTSQIPNKKTARGYRRHITNAMGSMGIERFSDLQPIHLMNYRTDLMADGRGMATKAQALIAVRSFLTWGAALRGHDMSMDQTHHPFKEGTCPCSERSLSSSKPFNSTVETSQRSLRSAPRQNR